MLTFIFVVIFAIGALIFAVPVHKYCKKHVDDYEGEGCPVVAIICGFISVVCVFALFISTIVAYSDQVNDFHDLKKIDKLEVLYQEKAQTLTTQFASYLAEAYPDHEKAIFDKISPEKIDLYLVKYPDLRSSETITALVGQISKLQAEYYQQKVDRINMLRDVNYRPKSPWIMNFFIPRYKPEK